MAYFLFVDESGQDRRESPYEVLAGIAIRERDLGALIQELHAIEIRNFGRRYSSTNSELKGKKLLKQKVFQHAALNASVRKDEIWTLAKKALDDGANAGVRELRALALAKINYITDVFDLCVRYDCKVFASVVETDATPSGIDGLRKDYAYLFERFFYFIEDQKPAEHGIVVFDELEKSKSHILINQMNAYFHGTAVGKQRASLIVPEPFFVHSELTTGIQLADLAAYCISWGFRTPKMTKPKRAELEGYARQIARLRYRTFRDRKGNPKFEIWSIAHIRDLRTNLEKLADDAISED